MGEGALKAAGERRPHLGPRHGPEQGPHLDGRPGGESVSAAGSNTPVDGLITIRSDTYKCSPWWLAPRRAGRCCRTGPPPAVQVGRHRHRAGSARWASVADHRGRGGPLGRARRKPFGVAPPFGQAPEADHALLPADRAAQLSREHSCQSAAAVGGGRPRWRRPGSPVSWECGRQDFAQPVAGRRHERGVEAPAHLRPGELAGPHVEARSPARATAAASPAITVSSALL